MEKICNDCHTANVESAINCGRCNAKLDDIEQTPQLKLARHANNAQALRNEELKNKAHHEVQMSHHAKSHRSFRNFATATMVILLLALAILVMPFGWDTEFLPLPEITSKPLAAKIDQALQAPEALSITGTPEEFSLYFTGILQPFSNIQDGVGHGQTTPRLIVNTDYPSQTIRLIRHDSILLPVRRELTLPINGLHDWQGASKAKFGSWIWCTSVLDSTRDELFAHAQMQNLHKRLDKIEVLADGKIKFFLKDASAIIE